VRWVTEKSGFLFFASVFLQMFLLRDKIHGVLNASSNGITPDRMLLNVN
jgi:hypothetical protein